MARGRPFGTEQFTEEILLEAVPGSKGIIGHVASRVGCKRLTVTKALKKYPRFRAAFSDEREAYVDELEGELAKRVEKGDLTSIIFGLKCLGKKRGYVERETVGVVGDMSFTFRWEGEGKKGGNVNNGPV